MYSFQQQSSLHLQWLALNFTQLDVYQMFNKLDSYLRENIFQKMQYVLRKDSIVFILVSSWLLVVLLLRN